MKTVHLEPPTEAVMADAGFIVAIGSDADGRIVASAQPPLARPGRCVRPTPMRRWLT